MINVSNIQAQFPKENLSQGDISAADPTGSKLNFNNIFSSLQVIESETTLPSEEKNEEEIEITFHKLIEALQSEELENIFLDEAVLEEEENKAFLKEIPTELSEEVEILFDEKVSIATLLDNFKDNKTAPELLALALQMSKSDETYELSEPEKNNFKNLIEFLLPELDKLLRTSDQNFTMQELKQLVFEIAPQVWVSGNQLTHLQQLSGQDLSLLLEKEIRGKDNLFTKLPVASGASAQDKLLFPMGVNTRMFMEGDKTINLQNGLKNQFSTKPVTEILRNAAESVQHQTNTQQHSVPLVQQQLFTQMFSQQPVMAQENNKASQEALIRQFENLLSKSNFQQLQNGIQQLTVKLHPASLGRLDITIQQINGVMTARLLTSTNTARELMESQVHQLKQAFQGSNLQVERIEITQQQTQLWKDSQEEQKQKQQTEEELLKDEEPDSEEETLNFADFLAETIDTEV
ncbi:flagellar hook-length control protein FliK [Alkalicoccus daliensis]|uniref:Hook-length control protein FliK n=1 Tax=Alkalicoccus daliensis TaxID=745820 RepID=A0A1H0A3G4_9BACI|nr:flagellar hook-length control protein FliK [Alkalicoccus daliensis]SDN28128.1 hook-length control protein FliK [Alkalicoccus daliensis]